jgi:hypothetical protein
MTFLAYQSDHTHMRLVKNRAEAGLAVAQLVFYLPKALTSVATPTTPLIHLCHHKEGNNSQYNQLTHPIAVVKVSPASARS